MTVEYKQESLEQELSPTVCVPEKTLKYNSDAINLQQSEQSLNLALLNQEILQRSDDERDTAENAVQKAL